MSDEDGGGRATVRREGGRIVATIGYAGPVASLWRVWTDVGGWGRWDLGLRSAALDAPGTPLAVGDEGTLVPVEGRAARFRVTALVVKRGYTFETTLPAARLVVDRRLTSGRADEEMDGETGGTTGECATITHEVRFEGPLGGMWSRLLGSTFARALPPTLERLVALAHDEPSAAKGA